MTWRVLISAPYLLPLTEEFRSLLEKEEAEIVTVDVSERLSEDNSFRLSAPSTPPFAGTTQVLLGMIV